MAEHVAEWIASSLYSLMSFLNDFGGKARQSNDQLFLSRRPALYLACAKGDSQSY
jgi:hypothetical protein